MEVDAPDAFERVSDYGEVRMLSTEVAEKGEWLTSDEAAKCVRLKRGTLERLRGTGEGPPFHKCGPGKRARVLYRRSDLMRWLEKFRFQSTAEYGAP